VVARHAAFDETRAVTEKDGRATFGGGDFTLEIEVRPR